MNTKYFFYVGGILGIFAISYFNITNEQESTNDLDSIKTIQNTQETKVKEKLQKKSIDILYLDEENKNQENNNQTNSNLQIKQLEKTYKYTEKLDINKLNTQLVDLTINEIDKVMKQKGFHNVSATATSSTNQNNYNYNERKRVIYADISKEEAKKNRNNSLPPSAPTIINKPNLSTVVDTDVYNQAKQIVAVDTYDDGTFEDIQEIKNEEDTNKNETKDADMIVPPQIGQ